MAVKPEIIKARLKALFPKANLSAKRLDALAAKLAPMLTDDADEAAVDFLLQSANKFNSFEEIAREDDRIRTFEAKATQETSQATISLDDTPDWAKNLIETNKKLTDEIDSIKKSKIVETKRQTAQSVFESSEVLRSLKPEIKNNWLNRIDINSEMPIEEQVKNLEKEFTDIRQEIANTTRYSSAVPSFTDGKNEPSAEDIKGIVDNLV